MINYVYQLVSPKTISVHYDDLDTKGKVIVRPEYMALCHADQRYYQGLRAIEILRKKLPMALIHESCGVVVADDTGTFKLGQKVVMIPNTPTQESDIIYENYRKGSYFLSSGHDGFMREFVALPPDRVVPYDGINGSIAAICEFVSVGMHAIERFDKIAHEIRGDIGIWGDGSLSYALCNSLHTLYPKLRLHVVGMDPQKLAHFTFVYKTYFSNELPADFAIDHAFECCGGEGSQYAIDDVIKYINPQGTLMLLGVSENKVPIYTRNVLEKGMTLVGCSRSGYRDFQRALEVMKSPEAQSRLSKIICKSQPVCSIDDIHRVFQEDLGTPFKTVFEWSI
jgi:ribitol-5-phosphate 2-dehydrogenase